MSYDSRRFLGLARANISLYRAVWVIQGWFAGRRTDT
jgi:hypothetical protein